MKSNGIFAGKIQGSIFKLFDFYCLRPKPSELNTGKSYQKYNHFPKTSILTLKDKLCRLIRKMKVCFDPSLNDYCVEYLWIFL